MKRKNASLFGNVLMGLGLVVMVVGVGYSILNQLPQFFAHGAILSIFVGAVLWLAGARVGGHEQVSDKY
ncbi:stress-induced protein YchH [Salmonella enterica subsp. enterica serovar Typhi]|nr:stress-induced protein YchH [Salmonella enterica subsp. enterica serovar Typhi]